MKLNTLDSICNWLNLIGLVYVKIVIDWMHTTINHASIWGYADRHGANLRPSFDPVGLFGLADLTGIALKKFSSHLVSLIKVEGLFSSYIVTHFDIVNSESLV